MKREMTVYERLKKEAGYALRSHSRNLVHEAYGQAKMAFNLGAISKEEFYDLNNDLVKNGLSNPRAELE